MQALQRIDGDQAEGVEEDDGQRIFEPAHVFITLDAAEAEHGSLDTVGESQAAVHYPHEVAAQRFGEQQQDTQIKPKQEPGVVGHEKFSGKSSAAIR